MQSLEADALAFYHSRLLEPEVEAGVEEAAGGSFGAAVVA